MCLTETSDSLPYDFVETVDVVQPVQWTMTHDYWSDDDDQYDFPSLVPPWDPRFWESHKGDSDSDDASDDATNTSTDWIWVHTVKLVDAIISLHSAGLINDNFKFKDAVVDVSLVSDAAAEISPARGSLFIVGCRGYMPPGAYSGDYSPALSIFETTIDMFQLLPKLYQNSMDLIRETPCRNFVGSPEMVHIQTSLLRELLDYSLSPHNIWPEATSLVHGMLSVELTSNLQAMEHQFARFDDLSMAAAEEVDYELLEDLAPTKMLTEKLADELRQYCSFLSCDDQRTKKEGFSNGSFLTASCTQSHLQKS